MTTPDRVRALLDERTVGLARRGLAQAEADETHPHLVCACGPERFGLPLAQVASVLPGRACTTLPGAPAALRGIVALSGQIVSVIDLGAALGLPPGDDTKAGHLVRLRSQQPPVAIAVDRVLGIAEVASIPPGESEAGSGRSRGLGADAVSRYAPPGSDATGAIGEGFSLVDLPRLLRRFLT